MADDPWAELHKMVAVAGIEAQAELNAAGQAARPEPGWVDPTPYHLRMSCLSMATERADGAAPLPLEEVLQRAERYWQFVLTGRATP